MQYRIQTRDTGITWFYIKFHTELIGMRYRVSNRAMWALVLTVDTQGKEKKYLYICYSTHTARVVCIISKMTSNNFFGRFNFDSLLWGKNKIVTCSSLNNVSVKLTCSSFYLELYQILFILKKIVTKYNLCDLNLSN